MKRYLLIITISLFLTFILGAFFCYPKYKELSLLERQLEEKTRELQNQKDYFSNLKQTLENLKNYQTKFQIINSALPSESSLPTLFNFLQNSVSQNGLILKSIGATTQAYQPEIQTQEEAQIPPSEKSRAKRLKETQIALQVSGSYSSLKNLLSQLENSARLLEINSVLFSAPKEIKEGELPLFNFTIQMTAYSY